MENADAIVLRTVDFSETSLILTLFTRQFGKIEALAKGGRRLKSPFESALDILARIRVSFLHKKGDVLDLLTEAKLIHRFRVTKSNLAGLFASYYAVELVDSLTETNDPNPAIYDLTVKMLARLEQGTLLMRSLIRFEGLLLRAVGQQPLLGNCAECGKVINSEQKRVAFGYIDGGALCFRCAETLRQTGHGQFLTSVSANALHGMKQLTDPHDRTENWKHLKLERNTQNEIRGLHNHYFSHLLGKRPRLYDWLNFIAQNDKEEIET
ncbi:MAG: DNA repair protein RecO [Planctomycetaceae bacterium]|jgi:DNA repair protein RecO (recombination protein O)|nr:DNA repair protein RecO [Planctomycetaceae bacterium]